MRGSVALVIGGTLLLAPPARADHSSVHATAVGEMATTDNLFGAGRDGDRRADVFFTLRPGVLYAHDSPQMIHDFTAEAEAVAYMFHDDRPLVMGRAGWRSLFFTGPRSQLGMTISVGTGLASLLSSRTSSDQTSVGIAPSGKVDVQQVDTSQSLSWVSSKHTRVSQGILGRYGFTDDGSGTQTDTREVGGTVGFERGFRRDTVQLSAGLSYLRLERIAPIGAVLGSRQDHQLNPRAALSWRREIDREWSTTVDGGVVFVQPIGIDKYNPQAARRSGRFGVFGGQIAYNEPWGRALLSARRNVSPNQFLAQNTVDDVAHVQLAVPLPWLDDTKRNPRLAALGSLGIERAQLIHSDTGATEGSFRAARVDLSIGWTPRPGVTYGVRYELVYQTGDAMAVMEIPSYYRNTLYVTFSVRYPDRVPGELPRRNRALRSDHKDLLPVGAEPVVIDILEEQSDDPDRR